MSRVAIVTGAGKRVGERIAKGLLADGWTVVAHVHGPDDPVPKGSLRVSAELGDADCAERIFAACPEPPHLLVNNAALFAADGLGAFSPDLLVQHMMVNVAAPTLLTERFAAARQGAGDRVIVNILDAKLAAPNPDFLSYTLSKAALAALTEVSARALATQGIRVNAIAPALMLLSGGQSQANFQEAHAHNPLGRGVDPDDVVTAIRFLLDSSTVTGEVLKLDSGQRFWQLQRDVQYLDLKEP